MVQLRGDLKEAVFAGKMFGIRFGGEKPLDRMNYDHLAGSCFGCCLIIPLFCEKVKKLTKGRFVVCNT